MAAPIRTFTVTPSLPPELERQRALVYNLRRAWNHDSIEVFRRYRDLWEFALRSARSLARGRAQARFMFKETKT